jgi:hypothetical protein
MRYWRFGTYQAEHDDMESWDCGFGRSIIVTESTSNQEQSSVDHNPLQDSFSTQVSGDTSFTWNFFHVLQNQIKAKLGQIPVLVKADFVGYHNETQRLNLGLKLYRFINGRFPSAGGNATNRYMDKTGLVTWFGDAYAPVPGQDVADPPAYAPPLTTLADHDWFTMDITSIVERALRDNTDIWWLFAPYGSGSVVLSFNNVGQWPKLDFFYFYPVEFYQPDAGGDIDLGANIDDSPDSEYYLGSVERGQTGLPTKGWLRNMSGNITHVELFDDHPEWEVPVQRGGAGTGRLVFVDVADSGVSQLYNVTFYSSTQFEVQALAHLDNFVSLHPQINGDASWRGDITTTFIAPTGGLQIPAAAWTMTGFLTDDIWEAGVRGNTTDTSWPADSNDQVEMTDDSGGSPDAGNWRPINGRRTHTSADADIDATTKMIPVRKVDAADYHVGDPAFIMNSTLIDEGTIKSVQARAQGTVVFSGSGLDDLTHSGNFNGGEDRVYLVQIDGTGTPDTFEWSNDGGSIWQATGVAITGSAQLLEDDVYVTFAATTGHTNGDGWQWDADTWAIEIEGLTSGSNSYGSGAIVGTTLPFRSVEAAVFTRLSAAAGASESPPSRLYLDDTDGFTQGDSVLVQQVGEGGATEYRTIATGGVQAAYLDFTEAMVNDYVTGDFATKAGDFGARAFWQRPVATSSTVEELKRFRLNARMS